MGKAWCRKDSSIILNHKGLKKIPALLVGMRHINVTSPYPFLAQLLLPDDQPSGLRVMNENDISIQFKFLNVLLGCFQKELKVFSANSFLSAVKSIVEFLGHLEKLITPFYDIPAGIDTKLSQQGHDPAQYFGDSPTHEGRVDILNYLAREPRRH